MGRVVGLRCDGRRESQVFVMVKHTSEELLHVWCWILLCKCHSKHLGTLSLSSDWKKFLKKNIKNVKQLRVRILQLPRWTEHRQSGVMMRKLRRLFFRIIR